MYNSFHNGVVQIDNYYNIEFVRIDSLKNPEDLLLYARDELHSLGMDIKWWLAFGTLLGFHRDGDFIPDDSDIDISIYVEDEKDVGRIVDTFKKKLVVLRQVYSNKTFQCVFKRPDGFLLDLSFFYRDGDEIYSHHETGKWVNKFELIDNRVYQKYKYGDFSVPYPIEEYLESRYNNWKIKSNDKSISQ